MWVAFELIGTGLTDELTKVIGPFETLEEAQSYAEKHRLDVIQLEPPEPNNPEA